MGENAEYLLAAFAVAWALVFGYLLVLFNGQRRLKREIRALQEELREKGLEQ